MTNQDIAARIVGYIRQAAIGDALVPYEQRVDRALQTILASGAWSAPQRQWLQRIAAQTKANLFVDREALDDPDLIFKREGGGFPRLDRVFEGELAASARPFNDSLWPPRPDRNIAIMSNVTQDIVQKLWNLCNVLKDDGVTYHQYVTELTYLLFLKMAKETGTEDQIPKGYRWDDLESEART